MILQEETDFFLSSAVCDKLYSNKDFKKFDYLKFNERGIITTIIIIIIRIYFYLPMMI